MTKVIEDYPHKFLRFFIFNSSWGPTEETEEEKLIYYYPDGDEDKHKHVGLIEALSKFMSVFSEHPAQIQYNMKTKTVFQDFDQGFVMVMTIAAPYKIKIENEQREYSYYTEKLHDNVLQAVLQRTFDLFKVFTGGFTQHSSDKKTTRAKCEKFFSRYVPSLSFSPTELITDLFGAVQFLTLEPLDFLHVQSFVNKVEATFPCVDKCLFLHHGNIVWSGLQQKETQLLYYYVYNTLLPNFSSKLSGSASKNSPFSGHQGKFLTGPVSSLKLTPDQVNSLRIPKVFVPYYCDETGEHLLKEYHFLAYHAIQSTLCLLIPNEVEFTVDFFKRLDGHLGGYLTYISADLLDVFGRRMANEKGVTDAPPSILSPSLCVNPSIMESSRGSDYDDHTLVYYNDANRAMKNTLCKLSKSEDVQHCISDLAQDFIDLNTVEKNSIQGKMTMELSAKLTNDDWLVGKKVDQRQVYLAFHNKSSQSLLEINDEADKVMNAEFKNICMPP